MALPELLEKRLQLPVVAAPMFLVSTPGLVVACCKNGVLGTFPALNRRSSAEFSEWLDEIEAALQVFEATSGRVAAPIGVNLIVHNTNPRLQADLSVCVEHRVPLVITSLGAATEVVDAVHSYGGLVFHDVTNQRHARKAAAAGVDGIIAVAAGAGGHAGTLNPFALVAEIRQFFNKTLLLAGCLSSGRDVASALQMGADLAYMGTRFINTTESQASSEYKQMILDCGADDIVHTPAVSGVPASFLRPSLEHAGFDLDPTQNGSVTGKSQLKPVDEEVAAWRTIWSAGQGCTAVNDVPSVECLVKRIRTEFTEAVADMRTRVEMIGPAS
ncbi:MAG: nitronate monooxygenase [Gammaproteobacteria bacterium]|nr:nitronate monooxygenase [Gammaproteobacteria bacterium]